MLSKIFNFKRKQLFVLPAIVTSLTLILSGCNVQQSSDTNKGQEQTKKAEESYIVKHAMGETKVNGEAKRIVVLTNEGTEAVLALGIKPVGAVRSWSGNPWYDHIKAEMEGVQELGTEQQPNLEAIAALKPDLIIGNKLRQEKVYEQLNAIAPTIFSETLRAEWKNNFMLYAEALNKKSEGEKILSDFDNRINEFKQKVGDKLTTKVSIVRFMPGKTRIYYKDTFSGLILSQLGFARPETQNKDKFADDVTKERIPEMDGDILFYFTYETGDGEASKAEKEWTSDPLWKNLNVVKSNKAFKVNDTIWNTAGGVKAANLLLDELSKYFLNK